MSWNKYECCSEQTSYIAVLKKYWQWCHIFILGSTWNILKTNIMISPVTVRIIRF